MAQVPSGLGWDCKDSYLVEGSSVILGSAAQIVGATSYYVADAGTSQGAVVGGGTIFCEGTFGSDSHPVYYKSSAPSGAKVQIYTTSNLTRWCSFEPTQVAWARVHQDTGLYDGGYAVYNIATAGTGAQSGIYYSGGPSITGTFINVPHYQRSSPALPTGVQLNPVQSIYKLNDGAAIACAVEYNDENGVRTRAFALISTIFSATAFSLDGISPATYVTYTYMYSGMRFYMSLYKIEDAIQSNGAYANLSNFPVLVPEGVFNALCRSEWADVRVTVPVPDPYIFDNTPSAPGGGDAEPVTDDKVGIVHNQLPGSYGFVRVFSPSESDLDNLYNYLWGTLDLDNVKRLFSSPMDSIIGLSIVPIAVSGTSVNFTIGGVVAPFTLPKVSSQYYWISCGSIDIEKKYGSYLDYEPYTQFHIYLPFIGMRQISADDIIGKQLILEYDIDIVSGTCVARLQSGQHLLYTWSGQCAMQLPINGSNWDSIFQTAISAATGIAGIATGGAGALVGGVASAAVNALSVKPNIQRSGTFAGSSGWMNNLTPYIIRSSPSAAIPGNQNKFIGYPSYTEVSLSSLSGYNEISSIHLEGIPATQGEITELENTLKDGVIF